MQRAKFVVGSIQWGSLAHFMMNASVPLVVLLFVRLELAILAVIFILASKWRVVAVQPRHWLANIRANSPDLIVNISFVILLMRSVHLITYILWVILYISWMIWLKPQSKELAVGIQSLIAHFLGLTALLWLADSVPEAVIVFLAWLIALSAGRHYFSHFEDPLIRILSYGWAFFVAQLIWITNKWLVVYNISSDIIIPQPALIVTWIAYIIGSLFYLNYQGNLRRSHIRQYTFVGCTIILVILLLTDWSVIR